MKHLFKLLTMAFICLIWLSSCNSGNVESKFISNDSLAIYTFSEDSLYIDDARNGTAKYEVSIGEEYKDTIAPLKDYVHTAI